MICCKRGIWGTCLLIFVADRGANAAEQFNSEVSERVVDTMDILMQKPIDIVKKTQTYFEIGGFPNNLTAADRDMAALYLRSAAPDVLFYGLEDGTFLYYEPDFTILKFREAGENYDLRNIPIDAKKHLLSCVDSHSGETQNCSAEMGTEYIKCVSDCKLVECNDEGSALNCDLEPIGDRDECQNNIKWCSKYNISTVLEEDNMGYVPRSMFSVNSYGLPEQEPGKILLNYKTGELGSKYFEDDVTMVNTNITGKYAYCGGSSCNAFVGVYQSTNYDPRLRSWYLPIKKEQVNMWTPPFVFDTENRIGTTYLEPIYKKQGTKNVFYGVLGADYELNFISEFLTENYPPNSDIVVAIVEDSAPNFAIAISSGAKISKNVLKANHDIDCPDETSSNCKIVRVNATNLNDNIIRRAFQAHVEAEQPSADLISFNVSNANGFFAYATQKRVLKIANFKWQIIVAMPIPLSISDEASQGSNAFYAICFIGSVGFFICFSLFVLGIGYRKENAMIKSDWRFSCAFIFFCSLSNLSTLSFLGSTTNSSCMLRMWLQNVIVISSMSPLLIKIWRMHKILSAAHRFKKTRITHFKAFLYSLAIPFVEIIMLIIVSFVDPPAAIYRVDVEVLYIQTIKCEHRSSSTYYIVQSIVYGVIIAAGCALIIRTRKDNDEYGEAKQLAFALYNLAFTCLFFVLLTKSVNFEESSKMVIITVCICWATVVSSLTFILPRLLAVHEQYVNSNNPPSQTSKSSRPNTCH